MQIKYLDESVVNKITKKEEERSQRIFYRKEIQAWPEVVKEKKWLEKIFFKKLIECFPELTSIKSDIYEEKYRIASNKLLTIKAKPLLSSPDRDLNQEPEPGTKIQQGKRSELKIFFKAIKQLIQLAYDDLILKKDPIIAFIEKGDIEVEISSSHSAKKYGLILNHNTQRAKAIYKAIDNPDWNPESKNEPRYLFDQTSIEEIKYFLVRSGMVNIVTAGRGNNL